MIMAIDRDVAAAATLLLARYGSRARVYAAHRAAKLYAPRDAAARQLWVAVVGAIEELQRPARDGEAMS